MSDGEAKQEAATARQVSMRISRSELASILDFDRRLMEANGIHLLTPEGRVLLRLALDGAMSVSAAQLFAGTSHSSYYSVLRRLKSAGLILVAADEKDGRSKLLSVRPEQS